MASIFSRQAYRHIVLASKFRCQMIPAKRNIHISSIAYAKKRGKVAFEQDEDLFADGLQDGDMEIIDTASTSSPDDNVEIDPPIEESSAKTEGRKKMKLTPEQRLARFDKNYAFVVPRVGKKPTKEMPQVRSSCFKELMELATTKEQMEKIVTLMPQWIASGKVFPKSTAEVLVRRCEQLHCPNLALQVFGDFSKYNVRLNLPAAHQLMHSLHMKRPLAETLAASALFRVYDLPPISQDLVVCSMLISACLHPRKQTSESVQVAEALIPHLSKLLKKTSPAKLAVSRDPKVRALQEEKEKTWVRWTLQNVDTALTKRNQGKEEAWLRSWRTKAGHLKLTTKPDAVQVEQTV